MDSMSNRLHLHTSVLGNMVTAHASVLHICAPFSAQSTKHDSELKKNSSNRQLLYIPQKTHQVLKANKVQLDKLKLALI